MGGSMGQKSHVMAATSVTKFIHTTKVGAVNQAPEAEHAVRYGTIRFS